MQSPERRREYQRGKRVEWRLKIIEFLGGRCVVCGATEGLEAHHKDPKEKKYPISTIWTHKWERQKLELLKCELRCHEHHRQVHEAKHGTDQKYRLGCRCGVCVEFYRSYKRAYMAKFRSEGRDSTRRNYVGKY
jgi:hypothetical protein